jgi:DNA polymerase III alpha subunit
VGSGLVQLRVRTEFSFREAFGKIPAVADRLVELDSPAAGIVDGGTWGHVRWAKELADCRIKPLFGMERPLMLESGQRPRFWFLARDTRKFYHLTTALMAKTLTAEQQLALLREAQGVVRFAGAALTDPETFDYVDLNPASRLSQHKALQLHRATGKPLVVTCDNAHPRREDADAFAAFVPRVRMTPQWILSMDELRAELSILSDAQFQQAVDNCALIAERCASTLPAAPMIHMEGDLDAAIGEFLHPAHVPPRAAVDYAGGWRVELDQPISHGGDLAECFPEGELRAYPELR